MTTRKRKGDRTKTFRGRRERRRERGGRNERHTGLWCVL